MHPGGVRFIPLLLALACLSAPVSAVARSAAAGAPASADGRIAESPGPEESGPLWLVGIVMADEPALALAILEDAVTGVQRAYRVGDRVASLRIKQILPDALIVDTGKGERRLPLKHPPVAGGGRGAQPPVQPLRAEPDADGDAAIPGRRTTVRLDRRDVATALANVPRILEQVELVPVSRLDEPVGFRIIGIPEGGILSRMGLRDGAVIERLDGEPFRRGEQAQAFLRRASLGGRLTMTVNKRRRTRHIVLDIR